MKLFFIGIFTFFLSPLLSQTSDGESIITVYQIEDIEFIKESDSIFLSFYSLLEKDTSSPFDDVSANQCPFSFYKSSKLSKCEYRKLYDHLTNKDSYQDQYALLNHSNINIRLYKEGIVCQDIHISSITRNMTINSTLANSKQFLLKKQITKRFEKYLTKLLKQKKLWTENDNFYDWGDK